jgi:hypothetical protein
MFTIDCPTHGTRMLLTERRIRSLRNTDSGIVLELECYCGHRATINTGRRHAATLVA